jgi:hypothetical protein
MNLRRIPLPAAVYAERHLTVVSVRGLAGGILLLPLLLLAASVAIVPIGFLVSTESGAGAWLAVLLCLPLSGAGIVWVVRQYRLPVPDTVVSDIGLLGDSASGWSSDIRWDQVRRRPDAPFDVWVAMTSGSEQMLRWLHFFTADRPASAPVERKLGMLVPGKPRCLWYTNAFALRRAVVLQLATRAQPPLRFDPMLFVDMGLHPRYWTPMPWPRRVRALLMLVPMVALFAGTFGWIDRLPSVWWAVAVLVFGMMVCAWMAMAVFNTVYPDLCGAPYLFAPPD